MSQSDPPLTWLRAFEAAGRSGSFKQAAQELNVSASTISHQVRDLEALLGMPLFDRSGRQLTLTHEGQHYLEPLIAGFQLIRDAKPAGTAEPSTLRIGAFPFLANELITPGLQGLRQRIGGQSIQVHTKTTLASLVAADPAERLDLVVGYGNSSKRTPGYLAQKLADVSILPIVPSGYNKKFAEPGTVLAEPLIRVIGPFEGWQRWTEAFCPGQSVPAFAIETDSYHAAALAVERGDGICLGVMPQIKPWLTAGRIQGLHQYAVPITEQSVYAFYAPHKAEDNTMLEAVQWLTELLE